MGDFNNDNFYPSAGWTWHRASIIAGQATLYWIIQKSTKATA